MQLRRLEQKEYTWQLSQIATILILSALICCHRGFVCRFYSQAFVPLKVAALSSCLLDLLRFSKLFSSFLELLEACVAEIATNKELRRFSGMQLTSTSCPSDDRMISGTSRDDLPDFVLAHSRRRIGTTIWSTFNKLFWRSFIFCHPTALLYAKEMLLLNWSNAIGWSSWAETQRERNVVWCSAAVCGGGTQGVATTKTAVL